MGKNNREIVQAVFDASAKQDWDTVKSYLHGEIEVIEAESLPYAGVFKGPDGFIALNQQVFDTWADAASHIDHLIADGDHVVVLGSFSGRGKETGQAFTVPLAAVWEFRGEKVIQVRPFYFDTKVMHDAHYGL
jgi:ketosteroid isomerase-like protein